jgi:hypothetical protein
MTRTRPHDAELAALARPCPYCAAAEGVWCMNYRSEYVSFMHAARGEDGYRGWPRRTVSTATCENRQSGH